MVESKLKIISATFSPFHKSIFDPQEGTKNIIKTLEQERKKEKEKKEEHHPILMVLPSTEETYGGMTNILPVKVEVKDKKGKARITANKDFIESIKKLVKAAKKHDAHIVFSGPEKPWKKKNPDPALLGNNDKDDEVLKKGAFSSTFLVNKEGVFLVGRQLGHDIKESPKAMKTIKIKDFKVLPLNCRDFLEPKVEKYLKKKKFKDADVLAVTSMHHTHAYKMDATTQNPSEYVENVKRMHELGLIKKEGITVISNRLGRSPHEDKRFYHSYGGPISPKIREIDHGKDYAVHVHKKEL